MYVSVCSFVQIDLLSAKCRSTVSSVAFLIGAAILFLHVPRRWADGARGARVRGIVALEIVRFSGARLFGGGAPVMPRYATEQRRAPPERCYRFGTPLVDVTHEAVGRRGPVALAATKLTAWLGVQTAGHSRR